MGVLLKGKTIGEVFELLQELKSVKAVAEEIGVTPGAVYSFRSENHKAFKKLKEESEVKGNENKTTNTKLTTKTLEPEKIVNDEQNDESTTKVAIARKMVLEKENKSLNKKINQLTSEKNQLHGRINLLEDEIKVISEEKTELRNEYEKLSRDYQKINEDKVSYKKQLDELVKESNNILAEAKKYREANKEYQNKLALLSERHTEQSEIDIEGIQHELAFYKDHALLYYQKVIEVS
ncbi:MULTISPECIES: hypothetical protein [Mammaliicoccus]|uniref:hypothetical protein n=1 Tax=Mammaliicoccus TaxID=2803850 RepID=UPI00065B77C4|nr:MULTISPECIES: hypothetical protein [Mammaliicoccus]AQN32250.1 hypothetical protein [Staphylococcus phage phi879]MCD5140427.1 hypothetical protein [Mammaliicoccus sciuri]PNY96166.1 hypothetical protein CD035_04130 [Mammaliicoccus sciuri]SQE50907.1 Uncharacterised protein [Mammaliicoccus sciuri]